MEKAAKQQVGNALNNEIKIAKQLSIREKCLNKFRILKEPSNTNYLVISTLKGVLALEGGVALQGAIAKDEEQYNLSRELADNHIKELLSKQKYPIIQFIKYISTEILARVQISNRKTCPD